MHFIKKRKYIFCEKPPVNKMKELKTSKAEYKQISKSVSRIKSNIKEKNDDIKELYKSLRKVKKDLDS